MHSISRILGGRPDRSFVLACGIALGLAACSSSNEFRGLGAEGEFLAAQRLYEKGRCFQAVEALQRFLSNHPGSARVDDAIYYLGLSHDCMGEYILAREEFDRVLREFPQSENREESEWRRSLTYFESRHSPDRDPEPTEKAVNAFETYLRHYPNGSYRDEATRNIRRCKEELAEKEYENGQTYARLLRAWDAALIYFQKSLEILEDSKVAGRARAAIAAAYAEKGDPENVQLWRQRLEEYATPERLAGDPSLKKALDEAASAVDRARARRSEIERKEAARAARRAADSRVESAAGGQP